MAKIRKRTWTNKGGEHVAWIVDYKDQHGKRHIETYPTRKKADAARKVIEGEVDRGTHTPTRASPTVAEAGKAWLEQAATDGLERATQRQYGQLLDHIVPYLGRKKLSELTVATVTRFRNDLIRAGRTAIMGKKIVGALGGIIQHAQAMHLVAQNVVRAEVQENKSAMRRRRMVEKRQERRIQEGVDYPTKDEIRAMLAAPVGARAHVLVVTTIFTGLRASELRGLRWCDVNFEQNEIQVRQRADRFNQIGPPKSAAGVREIPMGPYLANTLRAWQPLRVGYNGGPALADDEQVRCPVGPLDLVFPNTLGRVETLSTIRNRVLVPLQKSVGIESTNTGPKYGMHCLRHAAASLWIEEHAPKRVQYLMGHSTIALTFDIYGHLWASPDETEAATALERRLGLVS